MIVLQSQSSQLLVLVQHKPNEIRLEFFYEPYRIIVDIYHSPNCLPSTIDMYT